jgi:hypothetical protein
MNVFLEWNKCKAGTWCVLLDLDLDHEHFEEIEGVYIIWCGERNPVALVVGEGCIRDCLAKERNNKAICAIGEQHQLYVTWAKIGGNFRSGVVRFVAEAVKPKLASHYPDVMPIDVNLPAPWYIEEFPWE